MMAVTSALYYRLTKKQMSHDWEHRLIHKANNLEAHGAIYSEFGTRRRFDFITQDRAVDVMRHYKTFAGTSNPYLAHKYQVPVVGTFPHEGPMALSALHGPWAATAMWLEPWLRYWNGKLAISLTDTFTTDVFTEYFSQPNTILVLDKLTGLRQDSGCPYDWTDNKIIPLYDYTGVNLKQKTLFYSDRLTDKSYIRIVDKYSKIATIRGGIGTFITNDVGVEPLNIVIKLTGADFGEGMKNVVKLSDDKGKNTGDLEAIRAVKKGLGIK
jgi:nicotinate phosphoribosyltransferase